jgi:hypothetical protein
MLLMQSNTARPCCHFVADLLGRPLRDRHPRSLAAHTPELGHCNGSFLTRLPFSLARFSLYLR